MCDPSRPGAFRESTFGSYRAPDGPVWSDFQLNKSPKSPAHLLKNYRGLVQTDGAPALNRIGQEDNCITHLGCFSHYFVKAVDAREQDARPYLHPIDQLFRLVRQARHFKPTEENRAKMRQLYSQPLAEKLFAQTMDALPNVPPKTRLVQALGYLLDQKTIARRNLAPASKITWSKSIRPPKIGGKNWLQIGHPNAGTRLANLFTLVENCRLLAVDSEAYLTDMIARLPDHPLKRIAELLPHSWSLARSSIAAVVV